MKAVRWAHAEVGRAGSGAGLLLPGGPTRSRLGAGPVLGLMPLKCHSLESLGQRAHVFIFHWVLQTV